MPTRDPKPPGISETSFPPEVEGKPKSELEHICEQANLAIKEHIIPTLLEVHQRATEKYAVLRERVLAGEEISRDELRGLEQEIISNKLSGAIRKLEVALTDNFLASTLFSLRIHDLGKTSGIYFDYLINYVLQRKSGEVLPELPIATQSDFSEMLFTPENLTITHELLSEVLEDVTHFWKTRFEKQHIQLVVKFGREHFINHYRTLTYACFEELMENAKVAMPNGGKLEVHAKTESDTIVLTFKDTGTGMSAETLQKAMAGGFTTKKRGTGRGLGLIKSYFEDILHGKMEVTSEEGSGTTITIMLPLAK